MLTAICTASDCLQPLTKLFIVRATKQGSAASVSSAGFLKYINQSTRQGDSVIPSTCASVGVKLILQFSRWPCRSIRQRSHHLLLRRSIGTSYIYSRGCTVLPTAGKGRQPAARHQIQQICQLPTVNTSKGLIMHEGIHTKYKCSSVFHFIATNMCHRGVMIEALATAVLSITHEQGNIRCIIINYIIKIMLYECDIIIIFYLYLLNGA